MTHRATQATALIAVLLRVGAATAAEHGGEAPNLFAGTTGNIIVTLIIFGLVLLILGKFAWGPLLRVLAEREQTIRESLEDAKHERDEAQKLLEQYTERIEKARVEASEIVEAGRRNGEETARRIQVEARAEAAATVERGLREIKLATDGAKKEVYDLAAELAVDVAGRIIRKELSPADHKELVAESLERMRERDAKLN